MYEHQYVSFLKDEHLFGVNILFVREIIRSVDFTPVEKAPPSLRGLLNLRGQIITVIDPSLALGLTPSKLTPNSRCIILKTSSEIERFVEKGMVDDALGADAIGLLVDGISDVATAGEDGIDAPPANANGLNTNTLSGVLKLDNQLMLVLAMDNLLKASLSAQDQSQTVQV
jgi:purine-binding chemotaxis protein CheW